MKLGPTLIQKSRSRQPHLNRHLKEDNRYPNEQIRGTRKNETKLQCIQVALRSIFIA